MGHIEGATGTSILLPEPPVPSRKRNCSPKDKSIEKPQHNAPGSSEAGQPHVELAVPDNPINPPGNHSQAIGGVPVNSQTHPRVIHPPEALKCIGIIILKPSEDALAQADRYSTWI